MRTELIETLLKAGVVRESQVQRAMDYSFSTGLVERLLCLGYGSEDDIFKIIKNNLKLAVIEGNELENIPKCVLESVPSDMIIRNHFLPFYSDETKIHIAFFDPTKDSCFNEISFFTSKKIVPFGVRANVLAKALNRYFDLKVPEEFKFGKEQISDPKLAPPPLVEKESPAAKPPLPPIPGRIEVPKPPLPTIEKKEPAENTELQKLLEQQLQELASLKNQVSELAKAAPVQVEMPKVEEPVKEVAPIKIEIPKVEAPTPTPAPEPAKEAAPAKVDAGMIIDTSSFSDSDDDDSFNDFRDIGNVKCEFVQETKTPEATAQETEPEVKCEVKPEAPKAAMAAAAATETEEDHNVYVDTTSIELAVDKDQIIVAVSNELKKIAKRYALLFVKYDELVTADGLDIKIPLQAPSFFKDVHDSAKRFYGIAPKSYVADEFFNKLGGAAPQIICVVPVSIENEVFAIIYAEEVENPMQAEELAEKMAEAFERLLS